MSYFDHYTFEWMDPKAKCHFYLLKLNKYKLLFTPSEIQIEVQSDES